MLLYRLCTKEWQDDLIGDSGRQVDNYWTNAGIPCIYLHNSLSKCMIENRVFYRLGEISQNMVMVEYEVPENNLRVFREEQLPEDWRNDKDPSIARNFGTRQLVAGETFLLAFPSVTMRDDELIYIINPIHPLMKEVRIIRSFYPLRMEVRSRQYHV
ncbi:RES family NAD+ phosphorylase [Chitinophaga niabensis]|uniref:RES domain-containing protein n=1 Tax=Chitinophaga niabensis TaxID=536979 RepID=A0A1N6KAY7_9BACT|nr:RES family NAD+ phosphorylase [Chitinophaga niabensis]SIO53754.1 hypothetical protein SAMN04488055_5473 [Chitinophaga niabensis]